MAEQLAVIEQQIKAAQTLSAIVGTLRILAMVNIRRLNATGELREYAHTVRMALHVATARLGRCPEELSPPPVAASAFSWAPGLCGQFNDRVLEYARPAWSSAGWSWMVVGARLAGMLEGAGASPSLAVLDAPVGLQGITSQARRLLQTIEDERAVGHCHWLSIMFHHHRGNVRSRETTLDLLPSGVQTTACR